VAEALNFAAQLRMPADVTPREREQRVVEVMAILGLSDRRDVPIKNLSGGQLKRVSIGVELLTKPSLFFLDEATSGLDPGTEAEVMCLLRGLANDGCTVVLITHVTENIKLCNLVIFLAAGGRVAYFGPPDQAAAYFGVQSFNDIYPLIERERTPEEWQQLYLKSPQYKTYVLDRHKDVICHLNDAPHAVLGRGHSHTHAVSGLRQYWILLQREAAILLRDRVSLILNFSIPRRQQEPTEATQARFNAAPERRRNPRTSGRGGCQRLYRIYGEFFAVTVQRHWLFISLFIVAMLGMIIGLQLYYDTLH